MLKQSLVAAGLYEQLYPKQLISFFLLLLLWQGCIYQICFRSFFFPSTGTHLLIERSPVFLADKIYFLHYIGQVKLLLSCHGTWNYFVL